MTYSNIPVPCFMPFVTHQDSPEIQARHGVALKPAHCTLAFRHEHRVRHTLHVVRFESTSTLGHAQGVRGQIVRNGGKR